MFKIFDIMGVMGIFYIYPHSMNRHRKMPPNGLCRNELYDFVFVVLELLMGIELVMFPFPKAVLAFDKT